MKHKRYHVSFDANDDELAELFIACGLYNGLSFDTDKINSMALLQEAITNEYTASSNPKPTEEDVHRLASALMLDQFILAEIDEDGWVIFDNDYWGLGIVDRHHEFNCKKLIELFAEEEVDGCQQLLGYELGDIEVDGVNIAQWWRFSSDYANELGRYGQRFDNCSVSDFKRIIAKYKADLEHRDSKRQQAFIQAKKAIGCGELNELVVKSGLSADKLVDNENLIYIDDPVNETSLPGTYYINKPDFCYIASPVHITKDHNTFTDFDTVDYSCVKTVGDLVYFVGEARISKSLNTDEHRIFFFENTERNLKRFNHVKSKEYHVKSKEYHAQLEQLHCGSVADVTLYDELMCDYCNTSTGNRLHRDEHEFTCNNCGELNCI